MRQLQDLRQSNVGHLISVRSEASKHIMKKQREYLKGKVIELESKSKTKNIRDLCRGISDFKEGYQPRNSTVKDEKCDLVTGS